MQVKYLLEIKQYVGYNIYDLPTKHLILRTQHYEKILTSKLNKAIMLGLSLGFSVSSLAGTAQAVELTEYNFMGNGDNASISYSPLDIINAQAAYDQGYTGKGVTVGVNDSGVDARHIDLKGKSNLSLPSDWPSNASINDWFAIKNANHGTHVAGIIAASKNDTGMHGVAYDATINALCGHLTDPNNLTLVNTFAGDDEKNLELFDKYWASDASIKIINNSWGTNNEIVAPIKLASTEDQFWPRYAIGDEGKLMVFAASNEGTFGPSVQSFAYLYPAYAGAKNNILTVGSLSSNVQRETKGDTSSITTILDNKNLLGSFSCLALGNEESFILGTGADIYSVSANTTDEYCSMSGTSMATPSVSGVAALVQQAFPYLSGKQIGDVLLSTANDNVDFQAAGNSQFSYNVLTDSNKKTYYDTNLYFTDNSTTKTADEIKEALTNNEVYEKLKGKTEDGEAVYIRVFTNTEKECLIGNGVVDAGEAVKGLAELNARRLTNSDYSGNYTESGKKTDQAIYTVNTQGYDSTWSNDISEARVDKLSANSSQADLRERYAYYTTGKYTKYELKSDGTLTPIGEYTLSQNGEYAEYLNSIINYYNEYVDKYQSSIINTSVGLRKTGEGTLTLSGTNDYKGATIVDQGTLNINGSIDGDAYSEATGLLSGTGKIKGNAYDSGSIGAATPVASDTVLTINNNLYLYDNSTLQFTGTADGTTQYIGRLNVLGSIIQTGTANIIVDSKGTYNTGTYSFLQENSVDKEIKANTGHIYEKLYRSADANNGKYMLADSLGDGRVKFQLQTDSTVLDTQQQNIFAALNTIDTDALTDTENSRLNQVLGADLYKDSEAGTAKKAIGQLTSNANAQAISAVQSSTLISRMVSSRLSSADAEHKDPENGIWGKFDRSWGTAGSLDSQASAMTFGYDRKYSSHSQAGILFSYADGAFTADARRDTIKDYRLGFYNGYHNGAHDFMVYTDYGIQRHNMKGSLLLAPELDNDYNSRVLELGCEYKLDLHAMDGKIFHVSPYINAKLSQMWQNGYKEGFARTIRDYSGSYFATELGLEFARYLPDGSYRARLGFKEVWNGASTALGYSINTLGFTSESSLDRHFITASLTGTSKLGNGWTLEGQARIEKGAHDNSLGVSAMLKYVW